MSVFTTPLSILGLFALAGLALLPPVRATVGRSGPTLRENLLLAPGFGGLALAVVAWIDVSAFNGLTPLGWSATAVLALFGLWRAWRGFSRSDMRSVADVIVLALAVLVFSAFPFRNHIAPPGVDAQHFAFFTWLIDNGLGFPESRFWPSLGVTQRFIGTGGTEALAALTGRLGSGDAAMAHLHLAIAFVVAALLAALVVVRRLAPQLPLLVALPCLFFAFNSAFIWQYGDGAVTRVPAIAGFLLIAGLIASAGTRAGEPVGAGLPILVGLVHGAILAVHFRYFIWGTIILGLWLGIETWRRRHTPGVLRLWLLPAASAAVALPVVAGILLHADILLARGEPGTGGTITDIRMQSAAELWFDFFRFQGPLAHLFVIAGIAVALRRRSWGPVETLGLAAWLGVGLFLFDPLVQLIAPFTRSLLYPLLAAISEFSVPKLVFGTIVAAAAWRGAQHLNPLAVRITATACLLGTAALAALAWFGLLPLYNLQNQALVDLSFDLFMQELPGPFGTEFVYALGLLVLSACLFAAAVLRPTASGAVPLVAGMLALFGAHEVINGRFNRAELTPAQRTAYEWLGANTDFPTTLVLTASNRDIAPQTEADNVAGVADGRGYDWSLPWLPIVADRGSVFTRANFVARFTAAFPVTVGELPPLAALDRAYWHPADPESLAVMRQWGVTHIYVPDRYQPYLAEALARSPGVTRVFSIPSDNWPDRANAIYRLAAAP